jgi:hypothetical protein
MVTVLPIASRGSVINVLPGMLNPVEVDHIRAVGHHDTSAHYFNMMVGVSSGGSAKLTVSLTPDGRYVERQI